MRVTCDVLVIGGGIAGLTAGRTAAQGGADVILLSPLIPGGRLLDLTEELDYSSPVAVTGPSLAAHLTHSAAGAGVQVMNSEVTILVCDDAYSAITRDGEFSAQVIVLASGTRPIDLGVPGREEFRGRGISDCSECDAPLFRDERVAVLGCDEWAVAAGVRLAKFASEVFVLCGKSEISCSSRRREEINSLSHVTVLTDAQVVAIKGAEKINEVIVQLPNSQERLEVSGLFLYEMVPESDLVANMVSLDRNGGVIVDQNMKTSRDGLYAVGDVRSNSPLTLDSAEKDGELAGNHAIQYLKLMQSTKQRHQ